MGYNLGSKKYFLLLIFGILPLAIFNKQKIKSLFYAKEVIVKKTKIANSIFKDAELINITSRLNYAPQKAYFVRSSNPYPQPLIISLYTWGGTYKQEDSVLLIAKKYNLNYIHPDYGGQQWLKNSCCFDPSVNYIDEAIEYAISICSSILQNIYL